MADTTIVGSGTFVRGRITGSGSVELAGRLEGEIACSGEVLIDSSGLVGGPISGRRIVVRGAVKGDLVAEEAIVLEGGARVVGDLRAPRIAIAPGGLVRGHVQTGGAGAPRARSAQASASRATSSGASAAAGAKPSAASSAGASASAKSGSFAASSPPRAASPPPPAARSERDVSRSAREEKKSARAETNGNGRPAHRGSAIAGGRVGPPPPVVPALKKGTKAVAHHKKR